MAIKRFFIRKSHSELVQEQNRLIETLIMQQDFPKAYQVQKETIIQNVPVYTLPNDPIEVEDEFHASLDDLPFIPTMPKGMAKLLSVDTTTSSIDEEGIEKLKRRKNVKG